MPNVLGCCLSRFTRTWTVWSVFTGAAVFGSMTGGPDSEVRMYVHWACVYVLLSMGISRVARPLLPLHFHILTSLKPWRKRSGYARLTCDYPTYEGHGVCTVCQCVCGVHIICVHSMYIRTYGIRLACDGHRPCSCRMSL